jgi:hypothetical protein
MENWKSGHPALSAQKLSSQPVGWKVPTQAKLGSLVAGSRVRRGNPDGDFKKIARHSRLKLVH